MAKSDPLHDDVIKWKHFPRYWSFVRGIHQWPVNSPHKGQWRGALMFSLICAWIMGWVNNHEAGDLRRHRTHYDVIVMARAGLIFQGRGIHKISTSLYEIVIISILVNPDWSLLPLHIRRLCPGSTFCITGPLCCVAITRASKMEVDVCTSCETNSRAASGWFFSFWSTLLRYHVLESTSALFMTMHYNIGQWFFFIKMFIFVLHFIA